MDERFKAIGYRLGKILEGVLNPAPESFLVQVKDINPGSREGEWIDNDNEKRLALTDKTGKKNIIFSPDPYNDDFDKKVGRNSSLSRSTDLSTIAVLGNMVGVGQGLHILWGNLCQSIEGITDLFPFIRVSPDGNYVVVVEPVHKAQRETQFGPHYKPGGFSFSRWEVKGNRPGMDTKFYQDWLDGSEDFIRKGTFQIETIPWGAPHKASQKWELLGSGVTNVWRDRPLDLDKLWPWLAEHYPVAQLEKPLNIPYQIKQGQITSRFRII